MKPFALPWTLDCDGASASPAHATWIAELPGVVGALARRWELTVGPPFQPGGSASWVAPARDAHGRDRVLKVGRRHPESEHEADGLRAWRGRGAVAVYNTWVDGMTNALLLERCRPGTALDALSEADEIVATLLRGLWHRPPSGHPFRPLTRMCDLWADGFEERFRPGMLDPGLARTGVALFRSLPREPVPASLLVTDLHAGNVLAAHGGWRLIDPKPYLGDPAYDVLQHLLNGPVRLTADPQGAARRMADLVGLDPDRVTRWLFARVVVESVDEEWLRPVAVSLAPD